MISEIISELQSCEMDTITTKPLNNQIGNQKSIDKEISQNRIADQDLKNRDTSILHVATCMEDPVEQCFVILHLKFVQFFRFPHEKLFCYDLEQEGWNVFDIQIRKWVLLKRLFLSDAIL